MKKFSLLLCTLFLLFMTGCSSPAVQTDSALEPGNTLTPAQANALLQVRCGRNLVDIALEHNYVSFDTIDMCGGNSHLQGICVDDELKYMYFSYTSSLAKLDMSTGKVVASVGGFGEGSFGTEGGAHLGCLAYYDGWVYGSLEYKKPGKKFFTAAFDTSKLTEIGMDIKSDTFADNTVTGILLKDPTEDFRDPIDTALFTGQDAEGHATNELSNGHAFACSGIDGITFGTYPGDTSGKTYMIVAYGIYNFRKEQRFDNVYNVLKFYDVDRFWDAQNHVPTGTQNIRFTYERGLSSSYTEQEALTADKTLYVFTGNTNYGAQNIEYEQDSKDIVLYTYENTDGFGSNMYVIDGQTAPEHKILELGQHNTMTPSAVAQPLASIGDAYSEDTNQNGSIEDDEYLTGNVAVLKCICGAPDSHINAEGEWGVTGVSKVSHPICSASQHQTATTGIAHIGADTENGLAVDYFYIADGETTAGLYKRTVTENGSFAWESVQ